MTYLATASGRNLFPHSFATEVLPHFSLPSLYLLIEKFIQEMVFEEMRRIRNTFVEARTYFDKQGSLNLLGYPQALLILEVKSMKSS